MFEEIALKIGTILLLIIGTVMTIVIVACFTAALIGEFKKIKDKQRAKKEFRRKGEFNKLKGTCIKLTDEEVKHVFDFARTFNNFCKRYGLKSSPSSATFFIESTLKSYTYPEESNKKEK